MNNLSLLLTCNFSATYRYKPYTYEQVRVVPETEHLVRSLLLTMTSLSSAELSATLLPFAVAEHLVNLTAGEKEAKGTGWQLLPLHSSKSSIMNSALVSQSEPAVTSEKVWVTFWPVVRFSNVAEPPVREVATTDIWIESPSEMVMPVKSAVQNQFAVLPSLRHVSDKST